MEADFSDCTSVLRELDEEVPEACRAVSQPSIGETQRTNNKPEMEGCLKG